MSAAFVPTLHAHADPRRQGGGVAPRIAGHQRPAAGHRRRSCSSASCSPSRSRDWSRRGLRADCPASSELTVELTRINMPFLMLIAVAAAFMGMLNALRKFFIPADVARDVQRRVHRRDGRLVSAVQAMGMQPVMALSVGHAGRRPGADRSRSGRRCGARATGISWILNLRDPALREVLVLMGPARSASRRRRSTCSSTRGSRRKSTARPRRCGSRFS